MHRVTRGGHTQRRTGAALRRSVRSMISVLGIGFLLLTGAPVEAQQAPSEPDGLPLQAEPTISPTGAMVRAMIVPGWGHVAIDSYRRGAFYFVAEAATAYALVRTRNRLSDTRERADLRESVVRTQLAAEGVSDPVEIESRLDEDVVLGSFENLIESRESQQEDLVAFGIFLVFLSGADAFVSAHLSDFPAPIEVQALPGPTGGAELSVRVALGR